MTRKLEAKARDLPVLPTVIGRLLGLDPESPSYFDQVREIAESDPAYALRLLAAANAASVRGVEAISDLRAAATRLGTAQVAGLVMTAAVARVFVPRTPWERGLWMHALQVGAAARRLSPLVTAVRCSPEIAYLCGLLHDIGRFLLFSECPDLLKQVDERPWDTAGELLEAEREVCGVDHARLGDLVCQRWGVPDPVAYVVRHHHDPASGDLDLLQALLYLVHFADAASFEAVRLRSPQSTAVDGMVEPSRWDAEASAAWGLSHDVPRIVEALRASRVDANTAARAAGIEPLGF